MPTPLSFTPATYTNWSAAAYELFSVNVTLSGGNTGSFDNQLFFASLPNGADTHYVVTYQFRAIGPTPASGWAARSPALNGTCPVLNVISQTTIISVWEGHLPFLTSFPEVTEALLGHVQKSILIGMEIKLIVPQITNQWREHYREVNPPANGQSVNR